jgi:GNAT superfamily N-acetyltransferase
VLVSISVSIAVILPHPLVPSGLPVLAILVTTPEFQGRGVGRLLCNEGLKIADLEKLPVWLEASARGRRLYQKLGFEDVENIVIDLGK